MSKSFFRESMDDHPITVTHSDIVLNFPMHYHPHFEVVFVLDGNLQMVTDIGTVNLSAGDIALIPSLILHSYNSTEKSEIYTVIFENDIFSDVENYMTVNSKQKIFLLHNIDKEKYEIVLNCLKEVLHYKDLKDRTLCTYYSKILLTHLIRSAIIKCDRSENFTHNGQSLIKHTQRILMFIQEHYKETITLDMLSKNLQIDKYTISKTINNNLGVSLAEIVNKYRLLDVCRLLETTDIPVLNIAAQTGFSSASALYRNFQQSFHITPLKYRKAARGKPKNKN